MKQDLVVVLDRPFGAPFTTEPVKRIKRAAREVALNVFEQELIFEIFTVAFIKSADTVQYSIYNERYKRQTR